MLRIFFYTIAYILAFYGAMNIFGSFIESITVREKTGKRPVKLVIEVKDQEEEIEGIIREIYRDELFYNHRFHVEVEAIDLGSKDNTLEILRRLQTLYGSLEVKAGTEG